MQPPRLLLLLTTQTYRAGAFLEAAGRLGMAVTVGSNRRPALAAADPASFLQVDFDSPSRSLARAIRFAGDHPIAAVVAAEDEGVGAAAQIAAALGVPFSPPEAVALARDKGLIRKRLWEAGMRSPPFSILTGDSDPAEYAHRFSYPVVLKPTDLSASRGVIRADDAAAFESAYRRIQALHHQPEDGAARTRPMLVEGYIPGTEVALEALLTRGSTQPLAMFDKPDPLEGPYFEESIYVTPSRLTQGIQDTAWECVVDAVRALGLTDGPIHAEVRLNLAGAWLLEIAPRSIGGWCSRALRFDKSASLEEVILRHAVGEDVSHFRREAAASGVLMLPIPSAGTLVRVDGLDEARAIPGVEDVRLAVPLGDRVEPLPEGNRYLGFAFARAPTPAEVEVALRQVRERVRVVIKAEGRQSS
ncbi:MAG: ATP-grasp domain-containing protein [Anaerolineales bacterium]